MEFMWNNTARKTDRESERKLDMEKVRNISNAQLSTDKISTPRCLE
jgi:hypothetical protein